MALFLGGLPVAKSMSLYNGRYTGEHGCSDSTEKNNLSLGTAADAIVCKMVWCDVRTDKPVTDAGHELWDVVVQDENLVVQVEDM
jgi:hypothetical protein